MKKTFELNFIGIGAYKSGTTWLAQCLREHPGICIPRIKELEFFNKKYKGDGEMYSNYDKGIGWYEKQFRECDQQVSCLGEFSNAYLYDKKAPRLIKKHFPNIKLILCIRNPVDRAYSGYLWDKLNFSKKKFTGTVFKQLQSGDYLEKGMYGKYVNNYLNVYDFEDIHTILFDDIVKRPEYVVERAFEFLGVQKYSPPSLYKKINPAAKARSKLLTYLFDLRIKLEENNLGIIIDILKKLRLYDLIQNLYVKINRKTITKKPLTQVRRNELKRIFLYDILKTEKVLKIDLSGWK